MLNISNNQLNKKVRIDTYKSGKKVFFRKDYKLFNKFLIVFSIILLIILFLPWTQNVHSNGQVTTLRLDQRPQTIQSPIPGNIEKWFVSEGDFVKKGDTIMRISEIKSDYFDPDLIPRTQQQINAKFKTINSYKEKVKSLANQVLALQKEQKLKTAQAKNKLLQAKLKVTSDSIALEAEKVNLKIAKKQLNRTVSLEKEGLKATKDVEEKRISFQKAQSKLISQENKLLASKNDVINAEIELNRIDASYLDKISKARSDGFSAESNQYNAEAQAIKLENSFTNYTKRNDLYFIKATQEGYINKALRGGIGQTFKEGEPLVSIMPSNVEMAVEAYIRPIDLPLIHIGETVQIQFDGWPAIVFSGWPNASFGTFSGKVVAIENFISDNGKYRILIAQEETKPKWPEAIKAGSGAKTIALLKDVPIWFELWRKLNGFPPNYYQPSKNKTAYKKK